MAWIKKFALSLAKTIVVYALMICGGTFLLLVFSSLVGFLPYSDRPGPGWYNWLETAPDLATLRFFFSWTLLLLPYCLVIGFLLFLGASLLALLKAPRWLIGLLGALASGYLSLYVVLGIGWYIAIAAFPVLGAGVLGLLFGAAILPRVIVRWESASRATWVHWVGISAVTAVTLGLLAWPSIQSRHNQNVDIKFAQWTPGPEGLAFEGPGIGFDKEERSSLAAAGLTGSITGMSQASHACGGCEDEARVIIVLQHPIKSPVEFPLPYNARAVYVQKEKGWVHYPDDMPTRGQKIRIQQSSGEPAQVIYEVSNPRMNGTAFSWESDDRSQR
jgi:hypothetical protein